MKFYNDLMMSKFNNNNNPKLSVCRQQEILINQLTDKEGLDKAYARADKLYLNGNTMYVAGTSYLQDVWDDLKIPFGKKQIGHRGIKTQMLDFLRILRFQIWWDIVW